MPTPIDPASVPLPAVLFCDPLEAYPIAQQQAVRDRRRQADEAAHAWRDLFARHAAEHAFATQTPQAWVLRRDRGTAAADHGRRLKSALTSTCWTPADHAALTRGLAHLLALSLSAPGANTCAAAAPALRLMDELSRWWPRSAARRSLLCAWMDGLMEGWDAAASQHPSSSDRILLARRLERHIPLWARAAVRWTTEHPTATDHAPQTVRSLCAHLRGVGLSGPLLPAPLQAQLDRAELMADALLGSADKPVGGGRRM